MKNKSNVIFLSIIVIISSILFLLSCNNIFSPQNASGNTNTTIVKKTGSVYLNITKKDYRTLLPTFNIDHFDVTGDGPLSSTISLTDITSDTVTLNNLAVGEWSLTALGKDASDNTVAKGSAMVAVSDGFTNDVTIDVHYLADTTGTVDITINWPVDVSVDSIEFKKNSIDQTADVTSDISFTGNSINYLDNSAESNFYTYVFKFKHNNQIIATIFQSVHVYDYQTTSAIINLTLSNFSQPPVAPSGLSVAEGLSSLNINWVDNSNVEEGFLIERSLTSGGGFSAIGNTDVTPLPANTVNYVDNSVDVGITYYYRILAVNSFGASPVSEEANSALILPSVSTLNPISGSTGIPANTNIIISFNSEMNPSIFGTVTLSGYVFQNSVNCSMTISGNVLTINPNTDFPGGVYSGIAVSGFQDISGNLMIPYNNPGYNFSVNGMIAYYPFDATLDDMSGNGYNITFMTTDTVSNYYIYDRHSVANSATQLNDWSWDYLDTNITGIPDSFTISAWVYNSGMSMDQIVFSKYNDLSSDDKYAEMCLKKDMMGNLKFFMGNGIDFGLEINGNNDSMNEDMSNDKWHNVVVTFDGTTGNMYVDGALSGSGTFSGTRQNTITPLYFGYYSTQMSYYWSGKLDDIRIYNYAQNATDIANIYNSEKPLPFGVFGINYPAMGQTVEPTTDIRIIFDTTMDNYQPYDAKISFGNPPINIIYNYDSFSFTTTNKEYDTLIYNPANSLQLPADTYSGITITGFKNIAGMSMTAYNDPAYNFTIKGEVAQFLFYGSYSSVYQSSHYYSCATTSNPTFVNDRNNEGSKAISFNGVDNYLDTTITKFDGDFTLSAWVSYTDTTVPRPIISKYNTSDADSQFNLQIDTSGNLNFFMGNGSSKGITLDGNNNTASDLIANNWYHVAVSMNGTTGKLYINGTETDNDIFTGTRQTGTNGINIGRYSNGAFQYFNGKIDEVHVYNYALTSAEIGGIYSAEKPKVYVMNILSPADGALDVSPDANIVIQFSDSLDGTTFGTMTFSQPNFTYTNGVNCAMSFTTTEVSNDTVIIDPSTDFVGMQYMNITSITGFIDPSGDAIIGYSNGSYDFTTKSISLYYKFDGNVIDYSGYPGSIKLDGVAWNNLPDLTTDRHGNANEAYQFTSAQSKGIQAGNWVDIIGNEPITMSLWVKAASTDYASDQVISVLGTSDVDATRFGLYINGTTTDRVGFYGYGAANFVSDATLDTEWTHWSATYDGTTVKLYRNGIFNMSQNINLNIGNGSYGNPYVGTWSQSYSSYFFDGCIDEVRIYNYALTESEILAIYAAESTP